MAIILAGEHEGVARVCLDLLDLRFQAGVRRVVARLVEPPHFRLQYCRKIRQEVGNRGIDGELGNSCCDAALLARREKALGGSQYR